MNKNVILMFCAALALHALPAAAQDKKADKTVAEAEKKQTAKPKTAKKKPAPEPALAGTDEDEAEPDIASSTATDYNCELGKKLTIYTNANDDKHIAMRWQKRLMRLTRVDTTSGANRFENRRLGVVWLGIPAKGILLDSKKGQQLANECKNTEQMTQGTATPEGTTNLAVANN